MRKLYNNQWVRGTAYVLFWILWPAFWVGLDLLGGHLGGNPTTHW